MHKTTFLLALLLLLALAGCASAGSPVMPEATSTLVNTLAVPAAAENQTPTAYEAGPIDTGGYIPPETLPTEPAVIESGYPAPGTGENAQNELSLFPPTEADTALTQGNFFIDSVLITQNPADPAKFDVMVEGSLPTPCNEPRAAVSAPDTDNKIVVNIYTVVDPNMICTQVIKPFAGSVATLGGYPSGTYTVIVNDVSAGEIAIP